MVQGQQIYACIASKSIKELAGGPRVAPPPPAQAGEGEKAWVSGGQRGDQRGGGGSVAGSGGGGQRGGQRGGGQRGDQRGGGQRGGQRGGRPCSADALFVD